MALVVFLRGVNVAGHRTFRPSTLAAQLKHLDAVNIGAAGTFVIRKRVSRSEVRREFARRLPFDARIIVCEGRRIMELMPCDFFSHRRIRRDVVRFVSVLSQSPRQAPVLPMDIPPNGKWVVRILARRGRIVVGLYRRNMKAIGCLGSMDRLFGTPATTRNWNTITAVAERLASPA